MSSQAQDACVPEHSPSSVTHCDALIDATSAMVRSSIQAALEPPRWTIQRCRPSAGFHEHTEDGVAPFTKTVLDAPRTAPSLQNP